MTSYFELCEADAKHFIKECETDFINPDALRQYDWALTRQSNRQVQYWYLLHLDDQGKLAGATRDEVINAYLDWCGRFRAALKETKK